MKLPHYHVDAFADRLFAGNPAAVVFTEKELPAATMQSIAAENNLSETAFVVPATNQYYIRWFSPIAEVDLCGHATLASAHVLFNHRGISAETVIFSSKSGRLDVRRDSDVLYLNFPADTIEEAETEESLTAALGKKPLELYRGRDDYLAVYQSEEDILSLTPQMTQLSELSMRGIIVSAQGRESDFVSRFFAPRIGVPEDPVTGSAHTTLIPYWSKKLGIQQLRAKQLSARGGELRCRALGDRVEIGGRAVTYLVGEISL